MAGEIARARLSDELKDDEMITEFANYTLQILDRHLRNEKFTVRSRIIRPSVGDLLGSVRNICKRYPTSTLKFQPHLTKHSPSIPVPRLTARPIILVALEANQFNLSSVMGICLPKSQAGTRKRRFATRSDFAASTPQ